MKQVRFVVLALCLMCAAVSYAQMTRSQLVSYASSLKGLKKSELKTAIYKLCQPTTVLSYGSGSGATWSGFVKTDRIGTTLECRNRYSTTRYYFSSSSQTSAISGMNIEHSFPKSWWGGSTNNAYKDLFNLYPSESTANSYKSNYPMGKVTKATHSDYEIVGTGSAGSNGTIQLCEPNDTWKGDFCRSYFYMATIYQNLTWSGTQGLQELENDTWPTLQEWAYTLYLEWTRTDLVSDIEVDRNNAVYAIQGNRNLFIDFPMLAEYVWGKYTDVAFNPDSSLTSASDDSRYAKYLAGNYDESSQSGSGSGGSTTTETATAPTLTSSASFTDSYSVTITNKESGATVYYTTDGTAPTTSSSSFTGSSKSLTISATTTVKAMAVISGKNNSSVVSATYTKTSSGDDSSTSIANTAETAYTVAQAKALIDAGNDLTTKVYVKGIISQIGDLNSTYGELTYYISDDGTTTSDQFEIYDGFNLNQAKFTSTSEIEVGATVIVYGTLKLYSSSTYELNYGNYIVKYTAPSSGGDSEDTGTSETGTITFGNNYTKISSKSTTGTDTNGYTWTITTAGTSSFTSQDDYCQVGSSSKPATSITFTMTLPSNQTITSFSAKFGGFASTSGTITLKVGDTTVGTGSLSGESDVTVTNSSSVAGKVLTVTVTGIKKGVKCYYISYTGTTSSEPVAATLSSIALSGTYSTTLYKGDTFSSDGMTVTATYSDGTTKDVTSGATFTGYDMSTLGSQTVTVSYTEDGTTVTSAYTITVTSNLPGDVDVDGDVDMDDLTLLCSYLIGTNTTTISDQGLKNAELSGDSTLNIVDLAKLVQLLNK